MAEESFVVATMINLPVLSPRDAACQELVSSTQAPSLIESCRVQTIEQLYQLWEIDKEAYQDHSLEFDSFVEWWQLYPQGSRCLSIAGKIVASMGIYPIDRQVKDFVSGRISERDLLPIAESECKAKGAYHWYFSGIVIVPEWQNTGLCRTLLKTAIGGWLTSGHVLYPCYYYGQAQTSIGRKALELFGLNLSVEGALLPDSLDLYSAVDSSRSSQQYRFRGL